MFISKWKYDHMQERLESQSLRITALEAKKPAAVLKKYSVVFRNVVKGGVEQVKVRATTVSLPGTGYNPYGGTYETKNFVFSDEGGIVGSFHQQDVLYILEVE